MYFCDDGGQVSPSVMVLAANLCVGGLFICGCSSPSVMMTGADCGPCWQPVFISILVVCVYVCDDDWCWLQSVLLACVYLHLGGMCLCLWWWLVLTAVCVAGLCISPSWWYVFMSVMMTGADCSLCCWPVYISILVVCVYVCDDDWCWLQSVLLACVYLHLGGMCLCLWWWLVLTAVCVAGLCISPSWWYVFMSVMMTGADCSLCCWPVYISILVVCVYFCDGGRCLSPSVTMTGADCCLCWWTVFTSVLVACVYLMFTTHFDGMYFISVMVTGISPWWWQALISICPSPCYVMTMLSTITKGVTPTTTNRDILAKKRRNKERENKNKGKLCPDQLYRLSLSHGKLVASGKCLPLSNSSLMTSSLQEVAASCSAVPLSVCNTVR